MWNAWLATGASQHIFALMVRKMSRTYAISLATVGTLPKLATERAVLCYVSRRPSLSNPTFARLFSGSFYLVYMTTAKGAAMRAALRPYVTAGVALVGASVITIAPIAATPPDVKIANPAVQLAASPFDPYVTALVRARNNIEVLFLQALADPATPFTLEDLLDLLSRTCSTACSPILRPIFKSSLTASRVSAPSCN